MLKVETYCEILLNIFQVSGTQAEWHALASADKSYMASSTESWRCQMNDGECIILEHTI